jgi:hypothetical protein
MTTRERRYGARHRIAQPVYIRYLKRPFLGASARNLSPNGMCLAVRALTLPVGTSVELELHCMGKRWLLPAIVIHGDSAGLGVMFQQPQPALFRELTQTHRDAVPPSIAREPGNAIQL